MTLKSIFEKSATRHASIGVAVGALIPVVCLVTDRIVLGKTGQWMDGMSASFAVLLMPIVCGFFCLLSGRSRHRLAEEFDLRVRMEDRLTRVVHTDELTGIGNRYALDHDMRAQFAVQARGQLRGALFVIDLDRFKFVNDSMGHAVGDDLLIALACRLAGALAGVATLYRLGGDEFVVMLPGRPSDGKITDVCATIKAAFHDPFHLSGAQYWIGASIGITVQEPEDRSMSTYLRRADLAMYAAKEKAGTTHAFFEPDMAAKACAKSEIDHDLSRALANDEFYLEYQPIVGIESGAIRAFEALIRWRHPVKGIVPPDDFITAAEKTGLILPIGNWVVRTACLEAARWPAPTGIAVNVAGDQFKDRQFVAYVKTCLAEAGLAPGRLTIEVTESIFTVDAMIICDSLAELRAHGVRIALDDFGIGFSSINNLRRFPLDQLKVDRSFTQAMLGNQRDAELVDIILQLGNAFDVSTTIEGIETEKQLDFARSLGVSEAQGFLISKPVSAQGALDILARRPDHGALRAIA